MPGMDASTGRPLDGIAHMRQSVRDVLTTRLGTRLGRRTYGSELMALADRPLSQATLMDVYAATATAVATWESRLKLESVRATASAGGQLVLHLVGTYLPTGEDVVLSNVDIGRAS